VRGLVLLLRAADQLNVPLPVPPGGVHVSQLGALLAGVHMQPVPAETVNKPLLPSTPMEVAVGETA
jgi:hypothetical protein